MLRIGLWPFAIPPLPRTPPQDGDLAAQILTEVKKQNMLDTVKMRRVPQTALEVLRGSQKPDADRHASLRAVRVGALVLKDGIYDVLKHHTGMVTSSGSQLTLLLKIRTVGLSLNRNEVANICDDLGLPYVDLQGAVVHRPSLRVLQLLTYFVEAYFSHGPEKGAKRTELTLKLSTR